MALLVISIFLLLHSQSSAYMGDKDPLMDNFDYIDSMDHIKFLESDESHDTGRHEIVSIDWSQNNVNDTNSNIKLELTAFGRVIELWLKPVDDVLVNINTPIYQAMKHNHKVVFREKPNLIKQFKRRAKKYESATDLATIIVEYDDDLRKNRIYGHIQSERLTIRPLTNHSEFEASRRRRSSEFLEKISPNSNYHIVTMHPDPPSTNTEITNDIDQETVSSEPRSAHRNEKIPAVVYPEILVVVTYDLLKRWRDKWSRIAHILAFWNGVDMHFRNLHDPQWRLNIAGIILEREPRVLPYLVVSDFKGKSYLNGNVTMNRGARFWYKKITQQSQSNYDVIITMTTRRLCFNSTSKKSCSNIHNGLSYQRGVCNIGNLNDPRALNTAIIFDSGVFDGIATTVHELGHLFGSEHDPHRGSCSSQRFFIMHSLVPGWKTKNRFQWSPCSKAAFQELFESGKGSCLYNEPQAINTMSRYLPGIILPADVRCRELPLDDVVGSCGPSRDSCQWLKCRKKNGSCSIILMQALEGTKCGDNMICLRGKCVTKLRMWMLDN